MHFFIKRYWFCGIAALFFLNNLNAVRSSDDVLTEVSRIHFKESQKEFKGPRLFSVFTVETRTIYKYLDMRAKEAEQLADDSLRLAFWKEECLALEGVKDIHQKHPPSNLPLILSILDSIRESIILNRLQGNPFYRRMVW